MISSRKKILVQQNKTVRVAIYARYSSENQSSSSADDQISSMTSKINKHNFRSALYSDPSINYNFKIVENLILKDEAKTGRHTDRAGFQTLEHALKNKLVDLIFVDDLSRLARDMGDLTKFHDTLIFHGVELISFRNGVSSADETARMCFTVTGLVNEFSNKDHAKRTRRGQEERVAQGFSAGDICFGYKSSHTKCEIQGGNEVRSHFKIYVDEAEAIIVRKIFDMFIAGYGLSQIAKHLNESKIPSTKRGQKISGAEFNWSGSAIRSILKREKYIGYWVWGKTKCVKNPDTNRFTKIASSEIEWIKSNDSEKNPDFVIVSDDVWITVQKKLLKSEQLFQEMKSKTKVMAASNTQSTKSKLAFAQVFTCGYCNSPMAQVTKGSLGCSMYYKKSRVTCTNKRTIKVHKIETAVVNGIASYLTQDDVLQETTKQFNKWLKHKLTSSTDDSKILSHRLKSIESQISNLLNFIANDRTAPPSIGLKLKEKECEKSTVSSELERIKQRKEHNQFLLPSAMKEHFNRLDESIRGDHINANIALKKLFPDGLRCLPENVEGVTTHNQLNSKWKIEGRMLISPLSRGGFSLLAIGGDIFDFVTT